MGEFDEEASKLAQKDADRDRPLPNKTPKDAAISFALGAFLAVLSVELLMPLVGLWWAGAITILLAALIGWYDTRVKWDAHHKVYFARYEHHKVRRK